MLFECWVIYLGIRYIALCLYYISVHIYYRVVATTSKPKKHRTKRGRNNSIAPAPTESEQDVKGNDKSVKTAKTGYNPITTIPKRYIPDTDSGVGTKEGSGDSSHVHTNTEDDVMFNTGITHKPTKITGDPTIDNDIVSIATAVNNKAGQEGEGITSTPTSSTAATISINTANDPYGESTANKYGYYGKKSFASGTTPS
jgi:hypothetical protein